MISKKSTYCLRHKQVGAEINSEIKNLKNYFLSFYRPTIPHKGDTIIFSFRSNVTNFCARDTSVRVEIW